MMAVAPIDVDTSLTGGGIAGDMSTGMAGVDSDANPWLTSVTFQPVSQQDFSSAVTKNSLSFTQGADSVGKSNGSLRQNVVKYAKQFLGMQYQWGGSNPQTSFDCSGFTKYVTAHFGVHLPRVSYQQAGAGAHITLQQAQPGDLISWDNGPRNPGADHVALYIGNGQIMEFYRTGKPSRIRKLSAKENFVVTHLTYPGEK